MRCAVLPSTSGCAWMLAGRGISKMRVLGIVALGVASLLSGCITSAEQTKGLMDAWGDCVMATVIRMDDGKTDPVSLAYGIAPQCSEQYQRFSEAEVSGYITENGQRAQRQLLRDKEVQMITSAVLIKRAKDKPTTR
jgi:hypothetical protein